MWCSSEQGLGALGVSLRTLGAFWWDAGAALGEVNDGTVEGLGGAVMLRRWAVNAPVRGRMFAFCLGMYYMVFGPGVGCVALTFVCLVAQLVREGLGASAPPCSAAG